MTDLDLPALLNHVRNLGMRVGDELLRAQESLAGTASDKGEGEVDVVTAADHLSERLLTEDLAQAVQSQNSDRFQSQNSGRVQSDRP